MRPEPDEALRLLQERRKTGRASMISTSNDLLLFLGEGDTDRQSYCQIRSFVRQIRSSTR